MSLKKKIIWSSLLLVALAILPLLCVLQWNIKPRNFKQAESTTLQLIDAKAAQVGGWLAQRVCEIRIIHEHPACRTLDADVLRPYFTRLNAVVREQFGNPKETFAFGGTDGKGWVNNDLIIDISQRDYFQKAQQTDAEYVISTPVISKSDRQSVFIICYPIRSEAGETIGFINGSVNMELFGGILDSIDIYDGYAWIMNREGVTYMGARSQSARAALPESDLKEIAPGLSGSGMISLKELTGRDATLFYAEVPDAPDWLLCIDIENSNMHEASNNMLRSLLLTCLFVVMAGILLSIVISSSIVRPVQQLKERMLEVSGGNLTARFQGAGQDEIALLGDVYNEMLHSFRLLMKEVEETHEQKRAAELRSLQSQISPHFLYNTLDTIQWMALEHGATDAVQMLQMLSRMFRISLSGGRELIELREEIRHVQSYIGIQQIRYNNITFNTHIDSEAKEILVPKLIIQPLVENAIYHGIKPQGKSGNIDVNVRIVDNTLHISVKDSGVGIPPQKLQELLDNLDNAVESEHYGLYNINERLRLLYKESYSIQLHSTQGAGTEIIINIYQEGKADAPVSS